MDSLLLRFVTMLVFTCMLLQCGQSLAQNPMQLYTVFTGCGGRWLEPPSTAAAMCRANVNTYNAGGVRCVGINPTTGNPPRFVWSYVSVSGTVCTWVEQDLYLNTFTQFASGDILTVVTVCPANSVSNASGGCVCPSGKTWNGVECVASSRPRRGGDRKADQPAAAKRS
jgi:hypothetical protein